MKRKFKKVLRKLDESKLQPIPKGKLVNQLTQLYENLWSQFGLDEDTRHRRVANTKLKPYNVTDFAWTQAVQQAFYDHPYHKRFIKRLKKLRDWGWWVLQSEPCVWEECNG